MVETVDDPVPHCKLTGTLGREIRFSVWLPTDWNGKFVMGGGGGFVGSIQNQAMALGALQRGYATAGTDTGHQAGGIEGSWALNNLERLVNYGHVAIHRVAEVAKHIAARHYDAKPERAYFAGCSNGGRQAMAFSQRYPTDFDAILAGAPAFDFVGVAAAFLNVTKHMYPNMDDLAAPLVTPEDRAALARAVLARCDATDGLEDGIMTDPRDCDFDPGRSWICRRRKSPRSSPSTMVRAAAMARSTKAGRLAARTRTAAGAPGSPGAGSSLRARRPTAGFGFGVDIMRYMVEHDPDWRYEGLDFTGIRARAANRGVGTERHQRRPRRVPRGRRQVAHLSRLVRCRAVAACHHRLRPTGVCPRPFRPRRRATVPVAGRSALRRRPGAMDGRLPRCHRTVGWRRRRAGHAERRFRRRQRRPPAVRVSGEGGIHRRRRTFRGQLRVPLAASEMPMTKVQPLDPGRFDAAFDAAVAKCGELTRQQAAQFVDRGYVVLKDAFPRQFAAEVCEGAWKEMREEHAVDQNDPATWHRPFTGRRGMVGYIRTRGSDRRLPLETCAPRAFHSQADVIGGVDRLPERGEALAWRDAAIGNLGVPGGPAWQPPGPRQPGWHKDGWHFRHFLNSPEQGLLTVPVFSDIQPRSGGTYIASDSIGPVARFLARQPAGLHPDSVQGAGYLIPGLVEQCSRFEELTAEAGDMVLLHPYMLHRVSVNPSTRPRFIANAALVLSEPMRFNRPAGETYSLVELAVLRALGTNAFDFEATRSALAVTPGPFRNEAEAEEQRGLLQGEMAAMARQGVVTPEMGPERGVSVERGTGDGLTLPALRAPFPDAIDGDANPYETKHPCRGRSLARCRVSPTRQPGSPGFRHRRDHGPSRVRHRHSRQGAAGGRQVARPPSLRCQ